MQPRAIDIYDYDGTLCDSQEYVDRLSAALLQLIIQDQSEVKLSEEQRENINFLSSVEYTGYFWETKAEAILKEYSIDYNALDTEYLGDLNKVRKSIRGEFYGNSSQSFLLDNGKDTLAGQIKADLNRYYIKNKGSSPFYRLFPDIDQVLDNPMTIKAISTQRSHHDMSGELKRFPQIGESIGKNYTGMGYVDPVLGECVVAKPDPSLILTQYNRLIDEYAKKGADISGLPLRMTGDSFVDVEAMRNAQKVINDGRSQDQKLECVAIGVVRSGPNSHILADKMRLAARDLSDPSGAGDIKIHIVENFSQHRVLTDSLDSYSPKQPQYTL
tara:strand:+ start:95 stop:1081 length:987 start_codon:yes stop_codon:yes gene_type:complete